MDEPNKPRPDLWGDIVDIPLEATWEDVERRALTCPLLHQAVTRARLGHYTREQALIRVALWAANNRTEFLRWMIEHKNTEMPRPFLIPPL